MQEGGLNFSLVGGELGLAQPGREGGAARRGWRSRVTASLSVLGGGSRVRGGARS